MNITIQQQNWNDWLTIKSLSPRTIKEYNNYLKKLDTNNLTQESIIRYITKNNNKVARAFIKNLFTFIKNADYDLQIKKEIQDIELPKITGRKKQRIPDVLTIDQIHILEYHMKNERNKLMLLITFFAGLRVSELLGQYGIKYNSFNWNTWQQEPNTNGVLKVIGKGNKQRNVFLPAAVMQRVHSWTRTLAIENNIQIEKDKKLFCIGQKRWNTILHNASMKAVDRHINPHLIRHSTGTWLRTSDWGLDEIKQYLGHEHISTTNIYAHIDQASIRQKFNNIT